MSGGLGGSGTGAGAANTPSFGGTSTGSDLGTPGGGLGGSGMGNAGLGSTGGGMGTATATSGGAAGGLEDRANQVLGRAAEGLETAANRLSGLSERGGEQSGAMGKANDLAQQAASTMESTARYLRDNDVRALQSDVERMVREKPLQTLLIGVAAGWVLGKILR
jgi:ElaB/YqjD/DUF883 family membrane-anchored ribosome-binding protein